MITCKMCRQEREQSPHSNMAICHPCMLQYQRDRYARLKDVARLKKCPKCGQETLVRGVSLTCAGCRRKQAKKVRPSAYGLALPVAVSTSKTRDSKKRREYDSGVLEAMESHGREDFPDDIQELIKWGVR